MKKHLVIFFVWAMAQPLFAQTSSTPSPEQMKQMQEVIVTSDAWAATNAVVPGGISPEMLNDKQWDALINGYPTHCQLVSRKGDYTLLDGKNTLYLKDTTLFVWVSDVSVSFPVPIGTDVSGTNFLVATHTGDNKVIKSFARSGEGEEPAMISAKKSLDESSADVAKVAAVEWVKEDSSFITTMNGKDYFFQLDSAGKWVSSDPDAPKAIKVGDRKKDPTFLFDKNGDLVASNKRNSYKFGMGDYAGYRNNYYRNARNGAPLGSAGAYGYPVSSVFYQQPMMMGGWNNYGGWGGYSGCGFSAGLSVNFGWTSGCGYVNNNFCQPNNVYGIGSSTAFVWIRDASGYGGYMTGINQLGSGMGWSPSGYGGWKSNVTADNPAVETEEFYDIASAVEKFSSASSNKSSEVETFYDLKSEDLMTNEVEPSLHLVNSDLPPVRKETNTVKEVITASNSQDRKDPSLSRFENFPETRSANNKPVKPQENSDNEFASTDSRFQNFPPTRGGDVKEPVMVENSGRRQGNNSVQVVPDTKPGNDSRKPRFDGGNNQMVNATPGRTTPEKLSKGTNQRSLEMAENWRHIEAEQARRAEEAQMRQMDQTRGQRYQQPRPGPNTVRTTPATSQPRAYVGGGRQTPSNVGGPKPSQQRPAPMRQAPQQKGHVNSGQNRRQHTKK